MSDICLELLQGEVQLEILSSETEIGLVGKEDELVFDLPGAAVITKAVPVTTIKDDDYIITVADLGYGKTLAMQKDVDTKIFTLPAIVSGMTDPITLAKIGSGQLTINCDGAQFIGFSAAGGGLYNNTSQKYVSMTLLPVFEITTWILLNITGTWRK